MEKDLLKKIYNVLVVMCIVLILNTVVLIFVNSSSNGTPTTTGEGDIYAESVDNFKEISLADAVDLFDKKGTYVVYIGRPTCSACEAFVPNLRQVKDSLNFDVYYYDSTNLNLSSSDAEDLAELLPQETTVNGETGSYGSLLGTTPMLFIIEDGKMKDGIIGAYDVTSLTEFLNTNGIG